MNDINAKIQNIKNSAEVEGIYQRGMRMGFEAFTTTMEEFTAQRKKVADETNATLDETIGFIIAAEAAADKEGKGQYTDKELNDLIADTRKRAEGLIIENNEETSAAIVRLIQGIFKDNFSDLWGYGDILESEIARVQKENPGISYDDALYEAKKSGKLPEISESDMLAFNEYMIQMNNAIASMDVEGDRAYYSENGKELPGYITSLDDQYARAIAILGSDTGAAAYNELSPFERDFVYGAPGYYMMLPSQGKREAEANSEAAGELKGNYESNAGQRALRDEWNQAFLDQMQDLMFTRDSSFWNGLGEYYEKNKDRQFDIPDYIKTQEDIDSYITDMILDEYVNQVGNAKPSSSLVHDAFGDLVAQAGSLGVESANAYNSSFLGSIGLSGGKGAEDKPSGLLGALDIPGTVKYADGGRAVEAAIFGEAGPEWAIPESHTQRTAELLNSTRLASGFSWPELIASTGGLGSGGTTYNTTKLVFAPVIHAMDAKGVKEVLEEERRRFEIWYEEKKREEERSSWS
jgi:hypothetical protein